MKFFEAAMTLVNGMLNGLSKRRRIGTTSLLKKVAMENKDVIILVATQEQKDQQFSDLPKEKVVTVNEFIIDSGRPAQRFLVDNYAMIELMEAMRKHLIMAKKEVNSRNDMLWHLKKMIEMWEQQHDLKVDTLHLSGEEMIERRARESILKNLFDKKLR